MLRALVGLFSSMNQINYFVILAEVTKSTMPCKHKSCHLSIPTTLWQWREGGYRYHYQLGKYLVQLRSDLEVLIGSIYIKLCSHFQESTSQKFISFLSGTKSISQLHEANTKKCKKGKLSKNGKINFRELMREQTQFHRAKMEK